MKIEILESRVGEYSGDPGDIKDWPERVARSWIEAGAARPVGDGFEEVTDKEPAEEVVDRDSREEAVQPSEEWELKTSPEQYLKRYEDREEVSEKVRKRLELAEKLVSKE